MTKRSFIFQSKDILLPLYNFLVRLHLNYCVQTLRPHLIKDIQVLEKVQCKAMRFINKYKGMTNKERLRMTRLTTIETRRLKGDMSC